jgi:signal transduction histidine kinase
MEEKDRRKFVDRIALLAQKSSDIVGTLRELFSSLTIERKLVNIRKIVRAVVRLFRENGANVEYHFSDMQTTWPPVLGNPIALGQALHNVIRNAVEASLDESRVLVAVSFSNNVFEIRVADTGRGMSKETLEVLFEPFSSTKGSGMGLGLWLTQAIIELHDGEIEVMSKEGEGTEVLVRLPVSVGVEVGLA